VARLASSGCLILLAIARRSCRCGRGLGFGFDLGLGAERNERGGGADAGGFIGEVSVQEGVGFGWRQRRSTARDRAVLGQDTGWRKRKTLTRGPWCQRDEEVASVTVRLGGILGRGPE
jgi:hypothetical protein